MAPEPQRPIETLLRGIAKKRRDQAGEGLELDAFGRRRLQTEVERQFPAPAPEPRKFFNWFLQFGPRLAYAVALVAVLGAVVFLGLPMLKGPAPDRSQMAALGEPAAISKLEKTVTVGDETVADMKVAEAKSPAFPAEIAAGGSATATLATTDNYSESAGALARREIGGTSDRARLGTAFDSAGSYSAGFGLLPKEKPAETAREAVKPLAEPAGSVTSTNTGREFYAYGASLGHGQPAAPSTRATTTVAGSAQKPAQVLADAAAAERKGTPRSEVLASFSMEQAGRELRVIDGDGSVYTGLVEMVQFAPAPAASAAPRLGTRAPGRTEAVPTIERQQPAGEGFNFRVAGTNRSLKQNVVFFGRFNAVTNALLLPAATNAVIAGKALVRNMFQNVANTANTRQFQAIANAPSSNTTFFFNATGGQIVPVQEEPAVSGTVTLDDGSRVEIQAVPAGLQP
jgi:hypothetical protein